LEEKKLLVKEFILKAKTVEELSAAPVMDKRLEIVGVVEVFIKKADEAIYKEKHSKK